MALFSYCQGFMGRYKGVGERIFGLGASFFFFFVITEEPSMAKPLGLSMQTQTSGY